MIGPWPANGLQQRILFKQENKYGINLKYNNVLKYAFDIHLSIKQGNKEKDEKLKHYWLEWDYNTSQVINDILIIPITYIILL